MVVRAVLRTAWSAYRLAPLAKTAYSGKPQRVRPIGVTTKSLVIDTKKAVKKVFTKRATKKAGGTKAAPKQPPTPATPTPITPTIEVTEPLMRAPTNLNSVATGEAYDRTLIHYTPSEHAFHKATAVNVRQKQKSRAAKGTVKGIGGMITGPTNHPHWDNYARLPPACQSIQPPTFH